MQGCEDMQVCQFIAGKTVFHPETQKVAGNTMRRLQRFHPCICVKDGRFIESSGAVDGELRNQLQEKQELRPGEYNMPAIESPGLGVRCPSFFCCTFPFRRRYAGT
jgi:hypothetical protein